MTELSKPRIVCAAIRCKKTGLIVASPRHFDKTCHAIVNLTNEGFGWDQGFIDQHGTYYNRQEAWVIAWANGQVIRRCGGDEAHGGTLYSENLY